MDKYFIEKYLEYKFKGEHHVIYNYKQRRILHH